MDQNVCGFDRVIRLLVGTALALWVVFHPWRQPEFNKQKSVSRGRVMLAYIAAELLITGFFQWCPGNYILGIDTCAETPVTAQIEKRISFG